MLVIGIVTEEYDMIVVKLTSHASGDIVETAAVGLKRPLISSISRRRSRTSERGGAHTSAANSMKGLSLDVDVRKHRKRGDRGSWLHM